MRSIDAYWYSQNPIAWLLLPLSWVYCALAIMRRLAYRSGLFSTHQLPVPVIIVGNISVGGTGKTPLLIALCEILKQKGFKPGVISRGYGGSVKTEKIVKADDSAQLVGDEPLLIARRTACPVAVGANRHAAAELLLEQNDCNILLSDDGLQHLSLERDLEIVVIDAMRQFGNGFCLPAGPLREPRSRLQSVDLTIYHGIVKQEYCFNLKMSHAVNVANGESRAIEEFNNTVLHAVAGIGNPQRFFTQLSDYGLSFVEHVYPDHHQFSEADLCFNDDSTVLMTEKDAVKCSDFSLDNAWFLPVTAELSDALVKKLDKELDSLFSRKLADG